MQLRFVASRVFRCIVSEVRARRLGDLIVVDFTHNAKCRVWQTGPKQEKWFTAPRLAREQFCDREDLILKVYYTEPGISHFSSETYGWQDALADFFRSHSPLRLVRREYQIT